MVACILTNFDVVIGTVLGEAPEHIHVASVTHIDNRTKTWLVYQRHIYVYIMYHVCINLTAI